MKARFLRPQLPVKIITDGDTTYIFICQNEVQGSEDYEYPGDGQTEETYYEYDYNEIVGKTDKLPLSDIREHPQNYLDYVYHPESDDIGIRVLDELQELKKAIERGLML